MNDEDRAVEYAWEKMHSGIRTMLMPNHARSDLARMTEALGEMHHCFNHVKQSIKIENEEASASFDYIYRWWNSVERPDDPAALVELAEHSFRFFQWAQDRASNHSS